MDRSGGDRNLCSRYQCASTDKCTYSRTRALQKRLFRRQCLRMGWCKFCLASRVPKWSSMHSRLGKLVCGLLPKLWISMPEWVLYNLHRCKYGRISGQRRDGRQWYLVMVRPCCNSGFYANRLQYWRPTMLPK